jgi:hypothetical protein
MTLARLGRALAAAGVVAAVALLGAPLDASHSVDFESYNCPTESPPSDEEPDVTPPSASPDNEAPPAEPTPAPENCMPIEGDRIWGNRLVRFSSSTNRFQPMKRIALYIFSQEEAIPHANEGKPLLEELYDRDDDIRNYDSPFTWNSNEATPYNGVYKIRVHADTYESAVSDDTHRAYADRVDLRVDNPPKAVPAPKIIAKTLGSVTLQWQAAPEPDVLSYTVYRAFTKTSTKPPYANFKQVGITTGPAYRDTDVSPGFHWYTVNVTRRSVITEETGISSPPSAISDAAQVKSQKELEKEGEKGPQRTIPYRNLGPTPPASRLAGVADAPFKYQLPFDKNAPESNQSFEGTEEEAGGTDPRGPVLPVAVGMFLVSSALAVGRMPF